MPTSSFSISPGRILAFLITVSYYITAGRVLPMIGPVLRLTEKWHIQWVIAESVPQTRGRPMGALF